MSYIGNQPSSVAFLTDTFSGNASATSFTLSAAPATTSSIIVAVSGVLQDPSTYAVTGTTLNFSAAPPSGTGNISVRFLGIPASGVTTTAYRTVTEFTATAAQTTFTPPSYTVGFINVYRNGVLLGSADYTATNGTTVVLAVGATSGDLVTVESFNVSSVLNAIPASPASVGTSYLVDGSVTTAKIASAAVDLTTKVTGILPEANGGTGTTTGYYGFKNRIINGAMMIDQRNAGSSVSTGTGTYAPYTLDRWLVAGSGGGAFSIQQSSVAPPNFVNSILITVTTADSSIAAGDYYQFRQAIEGFNTADFGWGTASAQTVTLSFWVRSSVTGTYGLSLRNGNADRSYVATYTINSPNTWEQKTVTVAGDTAGTWATNNTVGVFVTFSLGVGSSFESTAGSWQAGSFVATSGSVDLVSTNGATFYITGVQLEVGSTATSFDYRPFGTELALCQRYYQESRTASGYGSGSTTVQISVSLVCSMRAIPSISKTSGTMQFTDGLSNYTTTSAPSSYFGNSSGGSLNQGGYSGLTGQRPLVMDGQASYAGYTFSAEL